MRNQELARKRWVREELRRYRMGPPLGWVRFGTLRRVPPISPISGLERGYPIDRYYIEKFLEKQRGDIRAYVLEIGDSSYMKKFGENRVTCSDVLHAAPGNPEATLVGNLVTGQGIPREAFDCMILTQTFTFIYNVRAAIATVLRDHESCCGPGGSTHAWPEPDFHCLGRRRAAGANRSGGSAVCPLREISQSRGPLFQAGDLYIHAARAEVCPLTIIEALACGTAVVATGVGGIPEQVKGLELPQFSLSNSGLNRYGMNEATGVLVLGGDAQAMAEGIEQLLSDDSLRRRLGENAALDAAKRFDLQGQADGFLSWYQEIVNDSAATFSNEARQA